MKTGAHCSPSGIASRPVLATLGIRALLAPNFRSRSMCSEVQQGNGALGIGSRGFAMRITQFLFAIPYSHLRWTFRVSFFLLETAASILANVFRITLKSHLLR